MRGGTRPGTLAAVAATGAAAALWGTSFIANDLGLREVDAVSFTALRFLAAAVAGWLLLLVVEPAAARAPPFGSRALWAFGALNALAFLLQYLGQERTSPARAALFVNANVFTVALLQLAVHRERPPRAMLAYALVAVAGVWLLTSGGRVEAGRLLGDALTFGSGAAFAAYIVLNKGFLRGSTPLSAVTWTLAATAVLLAPVALAVGSWPRGPLGWGAIAYTALVCTTLAYALWAWGLRRLSATGSAVLLLAEVPVATAISIALALDRFTAATAAGAALLFAGVAGATLLEARPHEPGAR